MFNVSLRYVRTCLDCRKAKGSEASEGFINLDSYNYGGNVIGLQEALNAYQSSQGEMLMNCMCTSAKEKSGDKGSENYNKAHIETRDITGYPEILLLKIKGRENLSNLQIQITDSVIFGGYCYVLQSGMLYSGKGGSGHWRCIVNSSGNLII